MPDSYPSDLLSAVDACASLTRTDVGQDSPLGWDVAALTDVNPLYAGSCGYGSQHSSSVQYIDAKQPDLRICNIFAVQVMF